MAETSRNADRATPLPAIILGSGVWHVLREETGIRLAGGRERAPPFGRSRPGLRAALPAGGFSGKYEHERLDADGPLAQRILSQSPPARKYRQQHSNAKNFLFHLPVPPSI